MGPSTALMERVAAGERAFEVFVVKAMPKLGAKASCLAFAQISTAINASQHTDLCTFNGFSSSSYIAFTLALS